MPKIRTYRELSRLNTFEERYEYLRLGGEVGAATFGFDRWINQEFYRSSEWKNIRRIVVIRDNGCDLGIDGFEIASGLLVHHMNPISANDITDKEERIFDPNFLITTTLKTHNAIHYGDKSLLSRGPVVRRIGDTTLW